MDNLEEGDEEHIVDHIVLPPSDPNLPKPHIQSTQPPRLSLGIDLILPTTGKAIRGMEIYQTDGMEHTAPNGWPDPLLPNRAILITGPDSFILIALCVIALAAVHISWHYIPSI